MNANQFVKQVQLKLKQAAPDIMLVAGVALSAVSVFEFCKKSEKGIPVVKQYKENLCDISEDHDNGGYGDHEYRMAVVSETAKTAKELVEIYWQPAAMWVGSTALIGGSHYILKDRNAALTVIATSLGAELKTLHARIIEKYGEAVDKELKYGTEMREVESRSIDKETGEEIVNKTTVPVQGQGGTSLYARYFDDSCVGWENNPEYVLSYLRSREEEANKRLNANGYLFLNDVYDMLGMKRTKAGAHVGWKKNSTFGDGYISFGIYNITRQGSRDFVNGYQSMVLLDFNVDGVILDDMPELDAYGNVIG